ncbi:hypothetical protein [Microbacterium terricola]|uniref:TetR family transcriptional regulator n=1 Tax=Microbacterium terricola TaxID=344163 RepID=A0ABM8E0Y2_9MICO|nr:hypothetical protein [Microbacterium terricola]UYK40800.1 hypothetical protein OAU46_03900 [Microbacterium terricola]BDV31452.1 TetR family transcriptional regulator [Microbacterium terricola]
MATSDSDGPRRGRGSSAGLDRDQIIRAARGLDPAALTMQAIATELGVDRKALNYHVTDRESLLEMLAIDAFQQRFAAIELDLGETWQQASRAYAGALCRSILETGEWVPYFRFTSPRDLAVVGPAEVVAARMLAAGFDAITVSRGMHLLFSICTGYARDAITAAHEGGVHPQIEELRTALASADGEYGAIRGLVDARVDNYGDAQFDFDVDAFVAAMERLLP